MSVWLKLFHGRSDPDQEMEDWGSEGPEIGPLEYVHWTYGTHLKLGFADEKLAVQWGLNPFFPEIVFAYGEFLLYNGVYYGDFSVYSKEEKAA